jgi:hypothetical protein
MLRTTSVLVIGLLVMSPTRAAEVNKLAYGAGMVTCGEWQKYRTTGNKSATSQLEAWIDGFLSGYNMSESESDDILAPRPQSVAYYAWIDNYCAQNPLNPVASAAILLKNDLVARARH